MPGPSENYLQVPPRSIPLLLRSALLLACEADHSIGDGRDHPHFLDYFLARDREAAKHLQEAM
ncbi:hypothetical protein M2650_13285 [Luteimonas sp. SX5]|uniref:Uncharacterized protein n=1 Tax=Luteimonas galliterrae TaxID=2940486 RepID=A0ABT0ML27_9GAMM|nr:hypothetical protein [Luteimonas galliterrae]MCL1635595.1 hypothetical protein [Luteimonas galliterrae]